MNEEGISNDAYAPTHNTTLEDLKLFQSFLYRNFKNYEYYD